MSAISKEEIITSFSSLREKYDITFDLKEEQVKLLVSLTNGRNAMGILGTGFGKSMTYILPPLLLDQVWISMFGIQIKTIMK